VFLIPPNLQGLENFKSLKVLSLAGVGLRSLEGLSSAPTTLTKLSMTDNQLNDSALKPLSNLTNLQVLELGGNRISKVEALKPLKELPKLRSLDLEACPVATTPGLREKIFSMLPPSFTSLNGEDIHGNPVDADDDDEEEEEEEDVEEEEVEEEGDDDGEDGDDDDNDGGNAGAGAGAGDDDDEEEDDDDDDDGEEYDEEEEEEDDDEVSSTQYDGFLFFSFFALVYIQPY
jgi:hypothetical protein